MTWLLGGGADAVMALVIGTCGLIATAALAIAVATLRIRSLPLEGRFFVVRDAPQSAATENLLMALHGLGHRAWDLTRPQPWVGLELHSRGGELELRLWVARGDERLVTTLVSGALPGATLVEAGDAGSAADGVFAEFSLARDDHLPLRTRHDDDPIASVAAALMRAQGDAALQFFIRPRSAWWQTAAHARARSLRDGSSGGPWHALAPGRLKATEFERARAKAIESKASALGFDVVMRAWISVSSRARARADLGALAASLLPFSGENAIALRRIRVDRSATTALRRFPLRAGFLLTTPELAALWHPPDRAVLEAIAPVGREPLRVAQGDDRRFGVAEVGGRPAEVGLSVADSRLHLHLLGATGTGKSTLLLNLAAQDIAEGRGVGVLDPKGDLVRGLLDGIPQERVHDVVLISSDDAERSVGLNPLEVWPGDDPELVAENALTVIRRVFERWWGTRTDDVLRSALLTLVHLHGSTLAHVAPLLMDDEFRSRQLRALDDPLGLEQFWRWFASLSDGQRREAIGPVVTKLRAFVLQKRLRRLLCQPSASVDMRAVVDGGKILLAELAVGRWGEHTAALAGSFLVARIWQSALARASVPEDGRRDFLLYLDEFQHFLGIGGPFADALAEARSLRLSLTLAHQHLGQLTREVREALIANARSRVVFQCGQDDAAYLARELGPLDPDALMSLGRFEAAARLVADGRRSRPFILRTLPVRPARGAANAADVRRASALRFGREVGEVDAALEASLPVGVVGRRDRGGVRPRTHDKQAPKDAGDADQSTDQEAIKFT